MKKTQYTRGATARSASHTKSASLARRALYLLGVTLMLTGMVACGPKRSKGSSSVRVAPRNSDYAQPNMSGTTASASSWGAIGSTDQNFSNTLSAFMYGITDLGFVSGNTNDTTGIRFRGSVAQKKIEMLVWDDVANQTHMAYFWSMDIVNVEKTQNGAVITVRDSVGTVVFNGSFTNTGMWQGTVTFQNSAQTNNASGTLGNFAIVMNGFF